MVDIVIDNINPLAALPMPMGMAAAMGLFYDDIKAFLCETPLSPIEVPHVINRWHQSWELTGRKSS